MNKLSLLLLIPLTGLVVYLKTKFENQENQNFLSEQTNQKAIYIPNCDSGNIFRGNLSNYNANPNIKTHTTFFACHDSHNLLLTYYNEDFYIRNNYTSCNDPLYTQDANEVFLADPLKQQQSVSNYMEVEVSPSRALFVKNITNHNETLSGNLIDCDESGISYDVTVMESYNAWKSEIKIPFELVFGSDYAQRDSLYAQGNFFRIDIWKGKQCQVTQNCYYYAFNPTMAEPPQFHRPQYFVDMHFI